MMDYEEEIAALKNTVFVLLEADQKRRKEYKKIKAEYEEIGKTLLRKDEGFQELAAANKTNNKLIFEQQKILDTAIIKISELEDLIEELA